MSKSMAPRSRINKHSNLLKILHNLISSVLFFSLVVLLLSSGSLCAKSEEKPITSYINMPRSTICKEVRTSLSNLMEERQMQAD
jgi:hypothetical protein